MKPGKQLSEPHLIIANQKKHINSLNRLIWILVHHAGDEVRVPQTEMNTPEGWKFAIEPDPDKPSEIVFKATLDAPNKNEKALTA